MKNEKLVKFREISLETTNTEEFPNPSPLEDIIQEDPEQVALDNINNLVENMVQSINNSINLQNNELVSFNLNQLLNSLENI